MTARTTDATTTGSSRLRAVVFDCDGLLADTTASWEGAFERAAAELGEALDADQLAALHGSSAPAAARTIASWFGRPEVARRLGQVLHDGLRQAVTATPPRAMPGARAIVQRLYGRRELAVSSNAPRDVLYATLAGTGLLRLVDVVVSADDVAAPKPAPDVYLAACHRLGVFPADAVAVEDSDLGASAAVAAGLRTVLVAADPAGPAGHRPVPPPPVALRVSSLRDPSLISLILSETEYETPPEPGPSSGATAGTTEE